MKKNNFIFLFVLSFFSYTLTAQSSFEDVEIKPVKLSKNMYVLYGQGGNIGLVVTDNGVYMIDDQFAELSPKILNVVRSITDQPINYLLNTHWHPDHTGGNENIAKEGALIVAHDNVFKRMSTVQDRGDGRIQKASPEVALPKITFSENLTLHLDRDTEMMMIHVHNAHTDTDSFIYFPSENVLHTGDVFFNGRYPFIDLNSGGSIDGLIEAVNKALFIVNNDTEIIPGHGEVTTRENLINYRDMLMSIRMRVKSAKEQGKTLAEIQKMGFTNEWDATLGTGKFKAENLIEYIYNSLDKFEPFEN